jgi:hypothetical protein
LILWTVPVPTRNSLAILWIPRSPFRSAPADCGLGLRIDLGPAEPLTFGPRLREPILDSLLRLPLVLAYHPQKRLCEIDGRPGVLLS